jgi:hypothetical protein
MRKTSYRKWTDAELQFIKDNSGNMKDEELSIKLNETTGSSDITVAMVRRQRRKLNITKTRGRRTNKVIDTTASTTTIQ